MGSGWYEREHLEHGFPFLDAKARFELFAEQVEVVVKSWTEDGFDHAGPAYELRRADGAPEAVPAAAPAARLRRDGARSRFAALAARHANEVNTLKWPLDELRERKERLDRACAEAGRDPATLAFSVMTACFLGADRAEARGARPQVPRGPGRRHRPGGAARRAGRPLARGRRFEEVAARIEELRGIGVTGVCPPAPEPRGRQDGRARRRTAAPRRGVGARYTSPVRATGILSPDHDHHRADRRGRGRMGPLRPL